MKYFIITAILAIFCSCGFDFKSSNGQVAINIDREIFKYYSYNSLKIYLFIFKDETTVFEDEMEYSDLDKEYFMNLATEGTYTIEIKAYYSSKLIAAGTANNVKITNDSVNEVNLFLTLL